MVELEQRPAEPLTFIRRENTAKRPNIRSFPVADGAIIELSGITDYKWGIYEPLLNALRATRKQTESGEMQIIPLAYEIVKSSFTENVSAKSTFNTAFQELNRALVPSGWSVVKEQGPKKPIGAPWFLRGPDDNGVYNKGVSKVPKQGDAYEGVIAEQRKRLAVAQFDRMAFGTSLLHLCLSHLTNPDAKATFTKDPGEVMSSLLPRGLKLQDIIGEKTPTKYFQESIQEAVNSMTGKTYEELSKTQQPIMPSWNQLKIDSGQHPVMIICKRFSEHNPNKPLDETTSDNDGDGGDDNLQI